VSGTPGEGRIRFASRVVSSPGPAVSRWKAFSGWKAARCPPRFSVPEILHSVEMLPVLAGSVEDPSLLRISFDAWIVDPAACDGTSPLRPAREAFRLPGSRPATTESALDLIEALAEWVEAITGRRCTEGALEKSLRAYSDRDARLRALAARIKAEPGFLTPEALRNVLRSGNFLPVESHDCLLIGILGENGPAAVPLEKVGDPFLFLARRIRRRFPQGDP
jgi:hypothetical protein